MSCLKPMLMRVIDSSHFNHEDIVRLKKYGWKFNQDRGKGYRFVARNARNHPLEEIDSWIRQEDIEVPCGSCLQCRLDYAQDWAIRCSFESLLWKDNYFLTLTYDDDHLKYGKFGNPTLDSDDIHRFIKSLRKKLEREGHTGIRYLLCGEYNSTGERLLNPHYHMILFNCPIKDLSQDIPTDKPGQFIHKINKKTGLPYFHSKMIADLWDKGYIILDDANFNTESYVTRYIMKKQKGENSEVYSRDLGVVAPFLRMSNRPGIGFNMFIKDFDKYIDDPSVILPRPKKKPLVSGLPKYFKRKLFEKDDSLHDKFEKDAKDFELRLRSVRSQFGTTSNSQRESQEVKGVAYASIYQRNFD